jgi:hypothetical protein
MINVINILVPVRYLFTTDFDMCKGGSMDLKISIFGRTNPGVPQAIKDVLNSPETVCELAKTPKPLPPLVTRAGKTLISKEARTDDYDIVSTMVWNGAYGSDAGTGTRFPYSTVVEAPRRLSCV